MKLPVSSSKLWSIVLALIVGGFALWWYSRPFIWLGIVLAVLSWGFTYLILNTRRLERFRRFFFIGIFITVFISFSVIIEIWNPSFILNWAPKHLPWMEYYVPGEAPGTLAYPCNRVVSQVFLGQAAYLPGLWTWETHFPATLGVFLLVMVPFLVTGIIFGRGFCGWICPFGGLPEAFATGNGERWQLGFLKEQAITPGGFHYTRLKAWVKDVKFGILLAVILLSVFLSFPVVCAVCPALWLSFMPVFWIVIGLTVIFAVVLPFMTKRRWWCYICPVGATCSILDSISFFRIRIDKNKCIQCMKCTEECRMFAMEPGHVEGKGVPDFNCIRCGRCIEACPTQAIDVHWFGTERKARSPFIALCVIAVLAWYIWFVLILVDRFINLF